ncbi:MAG TPA: hypothetical protein VIU82_25155 [Bosea sp. (in: a-proteobacteria)]
MTREKLPNRREALNFKVVHPGTEFHQKPTWYDVALGFPPDSAAPKEVFISCNKVTTALDTAGRDIATLISIALQYGASVKELSSAMTRDDAGKPQGVAGAVLDAVIAEMGR